MNVSVIRSIDSSDLPDYPIPRGERLESHSFFFFHYDRWLNSRLHLLGDYEVQGIALALYCRAQDQDPVGTLPVDPREIAALLRMSTDDWSRFLQRDPAPLHGWHRCRVGEEVRLMHPVVTEVALHAIQQRDGGADRRSADSERARFRRLVRSVRELIGEDLSKDLKYVAMLDQVLNEMFPAGNRTEARIILAAQQLQTTRLRR